jgi:hypothetical protein
MDKELEEICMHPTQLSSKWDSDVTIRLCYIRGFSKYSNSKLRLELVITVSIGNLKEIILKDVIASRSVLVYLIFKLDSTEGDTHTMIMGSNGIIVGEMDFILDLDMNLNYSQTMFNE